MRVRVGCPASMLNPTPVTVDSVRVYQGDPDLLPVYTHSTTLGFYSYVKKLYLYLTLGYRWGNSFSSLSKVNDEGINIITYGRASSWKSPRATIDYDRYRLVYELVAETGYYRNRLLFYV